MKYILTVMVLLVGLFFALPAGATDCCVSHDCAVLQDKDDCPDQGSDGCNDCFVCCFHQGASMTDILPLPVTFVVEGRRIIPVDDSFLQGRGPAELLRPPQHL